MSFHSDTDTEVLVNFIEYIQDQEEVELDQAVRLALNEVIGAYAIAVMSQGRAGPHGGGTLGFALGPRIGQQ